MWGASEYDFDPNWFNHSEECDESRMFAAILPNEEVKMFDNIRSAIDFGLSKKD